MNKVNRKTPCFLLTLVLLPLLLTGCWDRIEVNDIAFVLGSSIDKENGLIRSTVQIALPSQLGGAGSEGGGGGTSGSKTFLMLSKTAPTVYTANKEMQTSLSRVLNYSHRRVTLYGEEFARTGIGEQIDTFARFPQNRLTTYIVVTRGPAYKVLGADAPIEQVPAEMIREIAKSGMKSAMSVQKLSNQLLTEGIDPAIPAVTLGESAPDKVGDGQSLVRLDGLGVLRTDKLVGFLDTDDGAMALLAMNEAIDPKVSVRYEGGNPDQMITVSLNETNSKIRTRLKNSQIVADIYIQAKGLLVENTSNVNLESTMMGKLEKQCNDFVAERVREVANKVLKEYRSDIFGIGNSFHNAYPAEWAKVHNRWNDVLPEVEVRVHSHVHLENTGELINSLGVREDRLRND
ncbi:Ger(x)C family spore germination protein [Paenibacillus macerans]|uniref:Germination, Ger(X)C family protein n=1 Tax=Paenibacillus macerans TaxID=44252 RepID=A0A090YH49_PAEMA|nr:Ger(x)C family spore germination protein [Paenibacillus macerans]KFM91550.1 germination, Ger(x)C family protein [Paenibacillus macerans]MEC0333628.1 Ger(x)C family spore germination protein [Paenibacillus macerans]SUD25694.1 Spore germination protein KC [Paenibacillus macerans]